MASIGDQGLPFLLMKQLGFPVAENRQRYNLSVDLASPYLLERWRLPVGELNSTGDCFINSGKKLAGLWQLSSMGTVESDAI
jgi:hypothetical protein